ncbi:MAG: hypothetical protein HY401_04610 [Elusimicrobia bacterium]|nr:hypothetical protein [Elusimicrobiota bacterium]
MKLKSAALWRSIKFLLDKAVRLRLSGRYKIALITARDVSSKAAKYGFPDLEIQALWEILDSAKVLHPENQADLIRAARRASALSKESGDPLPMLEADVRWGALQRAMGQHRKAARVLKKCLANSLIGRDPELKAYALWNLGFALRMCLDLRQAVGSFRRSHQIFRRLGDSSGLAYSLCGLAGATRLAGQPGRSLGFYRRAFVLFQKERDPYGLAYTSCGMANALRRMGKYSQALVGYNRAERLYRKLGDRVNEGYVLWGRMVCSRALQRKKQAAKDLKRAGSIFRATKDHRGLALLGVWANQPKKGLSETAIKEARLS